MSTDHRTPPPAEGYAEVYRRSVQDPEGFWLDAARAVDWVREPTTALDDTAAPLYRWFARQRGVAFALAVVPLHTAYYLSNAVAAATALLR